MRVFTQDDGENHAARQRVIALKICPKAFVCNRSSLPAASGVAGTITAK